MLFAPFRSVLTDFELYRDLVIVPSAFEMPRPMHKSESLCVGMIQQLFAWQRAQIDPKYCLGTSRGIRSSGIAEMGPCLDLRKKLNILNMNW